MTLEIGKAYLGKYYLSEMEVILIVRGKSIGHQKTTWNVETIGHSIEVNGKKEMRRVNINIPGLLVENLWSFRELSDGELEAWLL